MPERLVRLLRLACLVLAGALLFRFGWGIAHMNPLAHLKIPAVPTLQAQETASGGKGTNALNSQPASNKGTNAVTALKHEQTNSPNSGKTVGTNAAPESAVQKTNTQSPIASTTALETNAVSGTNAVLGTNSVAHAAESSRTNASKGTEKNTTNAMAQGSPQGKPGSTNSPSAKVAANASTPQMPGMPGMPAKPRELSPEIQARVDRVTDSEILGPVMRPLPMALLGIAGNVAFIRTATGQTGLVKEGEDLGDVKLVRIGINRVLIEQEGQKKELMIFSGLGGESLLPKESTSPP